MFSEDGKITLKEHKCVLNGTSLYCLDGFFEVLKLCKWPIFSFFRILFSQMGLPKAQALQWSNRIVKRLNFTNDQHP